MQYGFDMLVFDCLCVFSLSLPPGPFPEPAARSGAQPRGGIRGPLQVIRGTRRPHFGAKCKVQKTTPLSHTVHTGTTPALFLSRFMACQTFAKCAFRRDEMATFLANGPCNTLLCAPPLGGYLLDCLSRSLKCLSVGISSLLG